MKFVRVAFILVVILLVALIRQSQTVIYAQDFSEVCDGVDNDNNGQVDDNAYCSDNRICVNGQCVEGERCNGADDNGNGEIDEGTTCPEGQTCVNGSCQGAAAAGAVPEQDFDGDGVTISQGDCNDGDNEMYPAHGETPARSEVCDGKDNDCNGVVDDTAACPEGQSCSYGRCMASNRLCMPIDQMAVEDRIRFITGKMYEGQVLDCHQGIDSAENLAMADKGCFNQYGEKVLVNGQTYRDYDPFICGRLGHCLKASYTSCDQDPDCTRLREKYTWTGRLMDSCNSVNLCGCYSGDCKLCIECALIDGITPELAARYRVMNRASCVANIADEEVQRRADYGCTQRDGCAPGVSQEACLAIQDISLKKPYYCSKSGHCLPVNNRLCDVDEDCVWLKKEFEYPSIQPVCSKTYGGGCLCEGEGCMRCIFDFPEVMQPAVIPEPAAAAPAAGGCSLIR